MRKFNFFVILRTMYTVLFLIYTLPIHAYYTQFNEFKLFAILLILLVLFPLIKLLFCLLVTLLHWKWFWIIVGILLVFYFINYIDEREKKHRNSQRAVPQYNNAAPQNNIEKQKTQMEESINRQLDKIKTPEVKIRQEEYQETCSYCNGTGRVNCPSCKGNGYIKKRCTACNETGKVWMQCQSCFGEGTNVFLNRMCPKCNGSGYAYETCYACHGSGVGEIQCPECDFFEHTVPCNKCSGTGYLTKVRIVEY